MNIINIGNDSILHILLYLDINDLRCIFQISKYFYKITKPLILDYIQFFKYKDEFKTLGHYEAVLTGNWKIINYLETKYPLPFCDYLSRYEIKILSLKGYGLILDQLNDNNYMNFKDNDKNVRNKYKEISDVVCSNSIISGNNEYIKKNSNKINKFDELIYLLLLSDNEKILNHLLEIYSNNLYIRIHDIRQILEKNKYTTVLFLIKNSSNIKVSEYEDFSIKQIIIKNIRYATNSISMFEFIYNIGPGINAIDYKTFKGACGKCIDVVKFIIQKYRENNKDYEDILKRILQYKMSIPYKILYLICNELNINIGDHFSNLIKMKLYEYIDSNIDDFDIVNIFSDNLILNFINNTFNETDYDHCYNFKYINYKKKLKVIEFYLKRNNKITYIPKMPDEVSILILLCKYNSSPSLKKIMDNFIKNGYNKNNKTTK